MRQHLTKQEWDDSPQQIKDFITLWLKRKKYTPPVTLGYCIELLIATTYNLRKDDSDGRFFNRLLKNHESSIGWEGEELIAILWYEIVESLKHRIASSGTFTSQP